MPTPRPVIAHILHRLDRAGAEVLAAGLTRSLRDQYESVFFCLDGLGPLAQELRADGYIVEAFDRRPGIDRGVARRMRAAIAKHRVALLHGHQYTPFFYGSLARGFSPRARRTLPLIFTEHGRHYPDHRSLKRVLANKLLLAKRDAVTAVGNYVRQALIDNEGLAPARVQVIHNGIEPSEPPTNEQRAAARATLGIDADTPLIMQVARFHPVKDHATAVRAFAAVHAELPAARLVLIGDGPQRPAIAQLAASQGIAQAVVFAGIRADVRKLLPGADVFLLSSLSEGISVTLLEAMDAALPIVTTDVGGNGEVVANGKTGLLAPRGDDAMLGRHLLSLLNNVNTARSYGQAGRVRLLGQFTQQRMHADYAALYRRLVAVDK